MLVVLQFSFAILLIICTFIVVLQIRYAQERAMGFERGQLVYHWTTGDLNKNYPMLRRELLASGVTTAVNRTSSPLTQSFFNTWSLLWTGKAVGDKTLFDVFGEDDGLVKTGGLQIVQGRDMDLAAYPTDSTAMLLNESAVRAMGLTNPIGQYVRDEPNDFHVVGVIKDFVIGSPYNPARPMVIEGSRLYFNVINMRLAPGRNTAASLATIRQLFVKYNPDNPFEYHFADDDYARKFDDTQRTATLTGLFAGLTIFISCLGLFGLAAYMAESRIREIGVRKVLGASVFSITALLTREFLKLVVLSLLIASPVAWYAMHAWLQGYSYRIGIEWWVFVVTGGLTVAISLLTVGYQAIAAAMTNPAKSLRPE